MNAYDRYLMFHAGQAGGMYTAIFRAIGASEGDKDYQAILEDSYPEEVVAYKAWRQISHEEFIAKCSPDNPVAMAIKSGEFELHEGD